MIKVENLSKNYGSKIAVDDVSFSVEKGEVLGFIGPNGAGKSTSMRVITGFLPASDGKVFIGDVDMAKQPLQAKSKIGYLPESAPLYTHKTVYEFLKFTAEIRGYKGVEKEEKIANAVKTCFLEPVLHQSIDTLSKGYKHRTCFAQAILHDPEVLILDEPTDGLDPNQKREVRNLIREMGKTKAIIISTHILEEVAAVSTKVVLISDGKKVFEGTSDELRAKDPKANSIKIKVSADKAQVAADISTLPSVKSSICEDDFIRITPISKADETCHEILETAKNKAWLIDDITTDQGSLEEVFSLLTISDTEVK